MEGAGVIALSSSLLLNRYRYRLALFPNKAGRSGVDRIASVMLLRSTLLLPLEGSVYVNEKVTELFSL